MGWWQRFLNWLRGSTPGGVREQVEDWFEANQGRLTALIARQNSRRGEKGHFAQVTRGWGRPTDSAELLENELGPLPAGAEVSIDVWEAPDTPRRKKTRKGWTLRVWVTEADGSRWVLGYDSEMGQLGWTELRPVV